MFASHYVNCFEIEFDAHSFRQQQDGATRRAGREVVKVHRHFRLTIAGSANQLWYVKVTSFPDQ
jgi:hypothetical protein